MLLSAGVRVTISVYEQDSCDRAATKMKNMLGVDVSCILLGVTSGSHRCGSYRNNSAVQLRNLL